MTGGRILRNTWFATSAEIGAKAASFVLFAVIARRLGSEEFGDYVLAFSVASLALTLADWGHDRVLTREVARDPESIVHLYGNTLALRLVVGGTLVVGVVACAPLLGFPADFRPILAVAGLATLADLMTGTGFAVFQAYHRLGFYPLVLVTQRWATALIGIAIVLAGGSVLGVATTYLVFATAALVVTAILLRRFVIRAPLVVSPRTWLTLVRRAAPLGVAGLFGVALFRIDTAMLGAMTSESTVGQYGAAYKLLEATLFLSFSVAAATYPAFSQRSPTSDPPIGKTYAESLKLVVALTLPLAVGFAVFADPLIELVYGDGFSRAGDALLLLAPAVACIPISYVTGYLLTSQHRERSLLWIYAVVATGNVIANLILIPAYSLRGAAVATSTFEGLAAIVVVTTARRVCGPLAWRRALAGPVIAAVAAGLVMLTFGDEVVVGSIVGACLYLATLLGFERIAHPDDLDDLRTLLSRRRRLIRPATGPDEPDRAPPGREGGARGARSGPRA